MPSGAGEAVDRRAGRLLETAGEALALAAREIQEADRFPARWHWVAVGLVTALQAALAAALSGYVTARPEDIADPSAPERLAPVGLLLRRAGSGQYLNPPERLSLPQADHDAILRLVSLRNMAIHAADGEVPLSPAADAGVALGHIRHLLFAAPAFDGATHGVTLALAGEALRELELKCAGLTAG